MATGAVIESKKQLPTDPPRSKPRNRRADLAAPRIRPRSSAPNFAKFALNPRGCVLLGPAQICGVFHWFFCVFFGWFFLDLFLRNLNIQ
jgi:hypothetical protein